KGEGWVLVRGSTQPSIAAGDSVHDAAALDDEELAGHEVRVGAGQEQRRAYHVLRYFDPLEGARASAALAAGADLVGDGLLAHRRAGREAVDVNAPGAELPGQDAGEGDHPALRRGVVGHVAQASEEGARGDVDDLAAALGLHDRDDGPTAEVDALQVDLEHAVPLLERQVLGGPLPEVLRDVDRRVVEQDVDAAVARLRLGHQARHALQIGHVGRAGPGGAAGRADLGRHALAGRRVQLGDDHLGAFLRDPPRIGPADPVAGAGDDRHLVLQPRAHAPLPRTTCYPQPYSLFRARC